MHVEAKLCAIHGWITTASNIVPGSAFKLMATGRKHIRHKNTVWTSSLPNIQCSLHI